MKKLKDFAASLKNMGAVPYCVLRFAVIASCAVLTLALNVLICAGDFSTATYGQCRIVCELFRIPPGVLMVAGIVAACFGGVSE